eukprot:40544-Rhodomonas_salina.1
MRPSGALPVNAAPEGTGTGSSRTGLFFLTATISCSAVDTWTDSLSSYLNTSLFESVRGVNCTVNSRELRSPHGEAVVANQFGWESETDLVTVVQHSVSEFVPLPRRGRRALTGRLPLPDSAVPCSDFISAQLQCPVFVFCSGELHCPASLSEMNK